MTAAASSRAPPPPTSRTTTTRTTTTRRVVRTVRSTTVVSNHHNNQSQNKSSSSSGVIVVIIWWLCLLLSLVLVLSSQSLIQSYHRRNMHHQLQQLEWTTDRQERDETYPQIECHSSNKHKNSTDSDQSSIFEFDDELNSLADLFVDMKKKKISQPSLNNDSNKNHPHHKKTGDDTDEEDTVNHAIHLARQHGAVILEDLVSQETTQNLRKHAMRRLKYLEPSQFIDVIAGGSDNKRWSFALEALEDDSVIEFLQELGQNSKLESILQALLLGNSNENSNTAIALMELQIIVSVQGAPGQFWHSDSAPSGSVMRFANSFVPLYSLLIPLQDTDPGMGSTAICPGSHRCHYMEACSGFQPTVANASEWNSQSEFGVQVSDPATGIWKAGTGLLYNSQTQHHGSAHLSGPARAALIVSFAGGPSFVEETENDGKQRQRLAKIPPIGSVYAIRPNHLGYTFEDLKDPRAHMNSPWRRTLGLDQQQDEKLGWNLPLLDQFRTANKQYGFREADLSISSSRSVYQAVARLFWVRLRPSPSDKNEAALFPMERLLLQILARARTLGLFFVLVLLGLASLNHASSSSDAKKSNSNSSGDNNNNIVPSLKWKIALGIVATMTFGSVSISPFPRQRPQKQSSTTNAARPDLAEAEDASTFATPHLHDVLFLSSSSPSPKDKWSDSSVIMERYNVGNRRWTRTTERFVELFLRYGGSTGAARDDFVLQLRSGLLDHIAGITSVLKEGSRFIARHEKGFGGWKYVDDLSMLRERTYLLIRDKVCSCSLHTMSSLRRRIHRGAPRLDHELFDRLWSIHDTTTTSIIIQDRRGQSTTPQPSRVTLSSTFLLPAPLAERSLELYRDELRSQRQYVLQTIRKRRIAEESFDNGQMVEFLPDPTSRRWVKGTIVETKATTSSSPSSRNMDARWNDESTTIDETTKYYTIQYFEVEGTTQSGVPAWAVRSPRGSSKSQQQNNANDASALFRNGHPIPGSVYIRSRRTGGALLVVGTVAA